VQDKAIIADPFLGSGTTLIAAAQLERICYGLEIAPKYCDVIVKRYMNHSLFDSAGVSVERKGATLSWEQAERLSKLPKVV
jgi:23S rRNA G2445 N2-methylase RlmL